MDKQRRLPIFSKCGGLRPESSVIAGFINRRAKHEVRNRILTLRRRTLRAQFPEQAADGCAENRLGGGYALKDSGGSFSCPYGGLLCR
jgi:hypothetical protein